MPQNNGQLYQQYHEAATEQLSGFQTELIDLAARYNIGVLGDMERRGVIEQGPGYYLSMALGAMELLKQSL